MTNFRIRPDDDYIMKAEWSQLYILTEHWKSDLLFYRDDLKFLHHLIDRHILWLTRKENLEMVRDIQKKLALARNQCKDLLSRVDTHLEHLSDLMENPFTYDSHTFRTEHVKLEGDIADFLKNFRNVKKETFKISEYLIEHEEVAERL